MKVEKEEFLQISEIHPMWVHHPLFVFSSSWATNIPRLPPGNKLVCFLSPQINGFVVQKATTTHFFSTEQLTKPQWIFTSFGLKIKAPEVYVVSNYLSLLESQGCLRQDLCISHGAQSIDWCNQGAHVGVLFTDQRQTWGMRGRVLSLLPPLSVESSALYHEATS